MIVYDINSTLLLMHVWASVLCITGQYEENEHKGDECESDKMCELCVDGEKSILCITS